MNKRIFFSVVVALLALTAAVLLVINRTPDNESNPDGTLATKVSSDGPNASMRTPQPERILSNANSGQGGSALSGPPELVNMDVEGIGNKMFVRVATDRELATVNQIPIKARDLIAIKDGQSHVVLERDEYEARLAKAVETELTLQAAQSQGVSLQQDQQERVANIAKRHEETFATYQQQGVTKTSVTPEQIAFQERQMAAMLLQQNMVRNQTGLAPATDEAGRIKYEAAVRALLDQLRANANVVVQSPQQPKK